VLHCVLVGKRSRTLKFTAHDACFYAGLLAF